MGELDRINGMLASLDVLRRYLLELKQKEREKPMEIEMELVHVEPEQDDPQFAELRRLLESEQWPLAVPSDLICQETEDDKYERAEGILTEALGGQIEGKRFLDFGCGEGHIVVKSIEYKPQFSLGFDVVRSGTFEWGEKHMLTNDIDRVIAEGPYDTILLYDVLDHTEHPLETLKTVHSLLSESGKVFVRCHPWSSRHGGHLYRKINKAFIHLVFDASELQKLGFEPTNTQRVIHPVATYNDWFKSTNFQFKEEIIKTPVEPFFKNNSLVKRRLFKAYADSPTEEIRTGHRFPDMISVDFCDYVLSK